MKDLFTSIKFSTNSLDRFYVRNSINKCISGQMDQFNGNMLDVGCGQMPYRDKILSRQKVTKYTGLDIESALIYNSQIQPDVYWDGKRMPFEDNSFDCILITEVLEHCPDPQLILNEIYRVLKKGGFFFFTVPFLWPLHEVPHDEYRYTPFSLERIISKSGFKNMEISALGGFDASLAVMLGLWLNRHRKNSIKTKVLRRLMTPVIKKLIQIDVPPSEFKESTMVTGFYGRGVKNF